MNAKIVIGFFLVGLVLLSGCTSETPRGDISAPLSGETPVQKAPGSVPAEPNVKDSYVIGETASTKSGLQVKLTEVARIPNCGSNGTCLGLYVKVTNEGDDEENDYLNSTVVLDDKGNQYEVEYSDCPNEYDSSNLFPGASREGYVCLADFSDDASQLKVVLSIGMFSSTKFVYLVDASLIGMLVPSGEFSIDSVDASFTSSSFGGYGTISGVKYTLKNTGETYLKDLTYDYTIKKKTLLIDSGKNRSLPLFSLEPGKTDDGTLLILKSIDQGGEYTIDVTVNSKDGEFAKANKTFNTD
ncbi:MAG: hypothetical protein FJY86_03785 [Candidatus Diapherotrites archaeon]|uniref:DUF4352 domain-containing protein n=1 Tax=Candidatus Iainarchaeum sp. TaxID=3101447 RepID=A0A8T4C8X8_9ARCH|nr:hypothetical protein [Candidatus Diapherotrites archaeon]